ncbi:flagellar hook-length control protein FliK [Vibrio mangrovi]|uniref:Flagellar hook-length control protein n=1 Tax=Vibrio mangrovi TaxID=474394 RepID=A0A1Y6IS50_9VIBR|nr:flagellar hook-length control protein FliK [Vibrio mangrovi]MDW6001511.1 flagellar hook-length control protein FliK [Vibrio mangrovi]SMS00466.1 Flagellar hook-length control protein [Vibrio mangrovi]
MNINLTPSSGTQKAQSHLKAGNDEPVSDDAVVGDVSESSEESGGFFAKLAALFKGEEASSGKKVTQDGDAKALQGSSHLADGDDISADALLSQDDEAQVIGEDGKVSKATGKVSGEQVSDEKLVDGGVAQKADLLPRTVAQESSESPVLRQSQGQDDSSAGKEAALRAMGEGEAVLTRLKGSEKQLVSPNGKKLPASDITEYSVPSGKNAQQKTEADQGLPVDLQHIAQPERVYSDPQSLQTASAESPSQPGEDKLTAEISRLVNESGEPIVVSASLASSGATNQLKESEEYGKVVQKDVDAIEALSQEQVLSPEQALSGGHKLSDKNIPVAGQQGLSDAQSVAQMSGLEHIHAADLSAAQLDGAIPAGAEGNSDKAVLAQKSLQSLAQDLPLRSDIRHHTHAIPQPQSQALNIPVNQLTQPQNGDASAISVNGGTVLPGDPAVSQAALQAALSAGAAGTEQWIRNRAAGLPQKGDSRIHMGELTDDSSKGSHFAQQLSSLSGQQGSATQNNLRADATQNPSSVYLAKDAMAADQLSERVQMMMSKNLKNIDIRLDPPELGRMHIRMNMTGDAATVHFTVATPQAREALEHSMPRLRDMLSQQGVQLGDTSVQHQGSGNQQQGYAASGRGEQSGQHASLSQDSVFHEDNPDTGVKLDLNVGMKRDGISYYA